MALCEAICTVKRIHEGVGQERAYRSHRSRIFDTGLLRSSGIPWRRGTGKHQCVGARVPLVVVGFLDCASSCRVDAAVLQEISLRQTQHLEFGSLLDRSGGGDAGDAVSSGDRQLNSRLMGYGNAEEQVPATARCFVRWTRVWLVLSVVGKHAQGPATAGKPHTGQHPRVRE